MVCFVLQFGNVAIVLCQVLYHYFPDNYGLWIMFAIITWEGLLGGSGYVNTFYRISQEVKKLISMRIII